MSFVRELADVINAGALLGALLFGLLIGASYGWRASPRAALGDVIVLFSIVLGFLLMRGVFNLFTDAPVTAARTVGGVMLWALVCAAVIGGRSLRRRFEAWRLARHIAALKGHAE